MKFVQCVVVLAVACFALGPANAAIETHTGSFVDGTNAIGVVSLSQFDTLGGTRILLGVTVTGELTWESDYSVANGSGATIAQITNITLTGLASVAMPDAPTIVLSDSIQDPATVFPAMVTLLPGESYAYSSGVQMDSGSENPGVLTNYIGVGDVDFDVAVLLGIVRGSTGGTLTGSFDGTSEVEVTVDYLWEERPPTGDIPEPATFAVWSLLGGIGLLAHRRRRR